MTKAEWPARLQRLRSGPLVAAAPTIELWLDGGHNPAAGEALAVHLSGLPTRPTYLICGMLNTKDARGFLRPLAAVSDSLTALSIPDEVNTLPASETARLAREVGHSVHEADDLHAALIGIAAQQPDARVLICGSLYLAGHVLRGMG